MSIVAGNASKGEKSKKFQSLNINNLYQGASTKPQQKTSVHKHGLQSLGKVPTARRAPANLPSLKAENFGLDPSVNLVPASGLGWGSQQQPPQESKATEAGKKEVEVIKQQQSKNSFDYTANSTQEYSGLKPRPASVKSGGKSFLNQQEFPTLESVAAGEQPQTTSSQLASSSQQDSNTAKHGSGPNLRPQTFGNWSFGGRPQQQQSAPVGSITTDVSPDPSPLPHPTLQPPPPLQRSAGLGSSTLKFDVSANSPVQYFGAPIIPRKQTSQSPPSKPRIKPESNSNRDGAPKFSSSSIIDRDKLKRMDDIDSNDDDWARSDETFDYNKKIDSEDEEDYNGIHDSNWTDQFVPSDSSRDFDSKGPQARIISQAGFHKADFPFFEDEDSLRAKKNEEIYQSIERARRRREEEDQKFKNDFSPPQRHLSGNQGKWTQSVDASHAQRRNFRQRSSSSTSSWEENSGVGHYTSHYKRSDSTSSHDVNDRKPFIAREDQAYEPRHQYTKSQHTVPPRFKRNAGELHQYKRNYQSNGPFQDDTNKGQDSSSAGTLLTWDKVHSEPKEYSDSKNEKSDASQERAISDEKTPSDIVENGSLSNSESYQISKTSQFVENHSERESSIEDKDVADKNESLMAEKVESVDHSQHLRQSNFKDHHGHRQDQDHDIQSGRHKDGFDFRSGRRNLRDNRGNAYNRDYYGGGFRGNNGYHGNGRDNFRGSRGGHGPRKGPPPRQGGRSDRWGVEEYEEDSYQTYHRGPREERGKHESSAATNKSQQTKHSSASEKNYSETSEEPERNGWFAPRGQPSRRGRGGMPSSSSYRNSNKFENESNFYVTEEAEVDSRDAEMDKSQARARSISGDDDHDTEAKIHQRQGSGNHQHSLQTSAKPDGKSYAQIESKDFRKDAHFSHPGKPIPYDRRQNKLPPRLAKQKEQNRMKREGWTAEGKWSNDLEESDKIQEKGLLKSDLSTVENLLKDNSLNDASQLENVPVQTIVFENTNLKGMDGSLKNPGIQLPVGFEGPVSNKPEDSSDFKLDFTFETPEMDSGTVEDKAVRRQGLSTVPALADDLNLKIASVKKVWETDANPVTEVNTVVTQSGFGPQGFVSTDKSFPSESPDILNEESSSYDKSDLSAANVAKVRPQLQQQLHQQAQHLLAPQSLQMDRANLAFRGILGSGGMPTLHSPPSLLNQHPSFYQAFPVDPSRAVTNQIFPAAYHGLNAQSMLMQTSAGLSNSTELFGPPPTTSHFQMPSTVSGPFPAQQSTANQLLLSQNLMTSAMKNSAQVGAIGNKSGNTTGYQHQGGGIGALTASTPSPVIIPLDGSANPMNYLHGALQRNATAAGQTAFFQSLANSHARQQTPFNMQGFAQQMISSQYRTVGQQQQNMPYMKSDSNASMKNSNNRNDNLGMGNHLSGYQTQHAINSHKATTSMSNMFLRAQMSGALGAGGPMSTIAQSQMTNSMEGAYSPTPIQRPQGKPSNETDKTSDISASGKPVDKE